MNKEDKELLLKDIFARLPYKIKFKADDAEYIREIHYIKDENVYIREYQNLPYWIETIKPYLRPMSSMTEEERKELKELCKDDLRDFAKFIKEGHGLSHDGLYMFDKLRQFDWLNKHHFDYRGLIPMGLALPATEEMYK